MTEMEAFRHPVNAHSYRLCRSLGLAPLDYQSPWAQLATWRLRQAERMDFTLEEAIEALDAAPRAKALCFLLEDPARPGELRELEGFVEEPDPMTAGRLLLSHLKEVLVQKLGAAWDPGVLWDAAPPPALWT